MTAPAEQCARAFAHREVDGHVLCPYIKRETTEQWCHTHDQDYYERCLYRGGP